ncbi:Signal recognition particle subunit SRP68 [Penicillium longicatenatum]|uniref:Signal recognition particle subunit SRP68 n=1 Tax=Penicillium longicatenatum TaxID=1561947 RepID=UPI0025483935|nr:Signal recognition particle subunit SRP68 [Penicillium longicatenatum]KAJ5636638.1 Signal recognition particle subunit SRP68 [Penicillium longicatenatum]
MEITDYIFKEREEVLLVGDYNAYRAHATRKLHKLRKKLGQATAKGRKYTAKPAVTPENVGDNVAYVHLLLLGSERAWAQAMHMKSTHSADPSAKGISGAARRHIISRLNKATGYAQHLVSLLHEQSVSCASDIDVLEARAYLATISGALCLEKRKWEQCLHDYAIARVIYTALGQQVKKDAFRDLLTGTVDPSLRYAAYQMKLPRSKPTSSLAIEFFPSNSEIRSEVEKFDPSCLAEEAAGTRRTAEGEVQKLPESVTWRSRTVPLEDASISQALAAASAAEALLATWLTEAGRSATAKDQAAAYDNVIIASQDAVDATKTAIDDLASEGVDAGDKRMQALQITRTSVNYSLIGWRVGRNRVLCGGKDGLTFEDEQVSANKKTSKQNSGNGKKLNRIRERVVLYDSTLQSLDFILELPGVAADSAFVQDLEAKRSYFRALRCLALGRSHAVLGKPTEALALFAHAFDLVRSETSLSSIDSEGPPRLNVSRVQVSALTTTLQELVAQYRGLATLERFDTNSGASQQRPLVERLQQFAPETDLKNLVPYPPQMQPVPVKPLFLDVAWNYIDYPRSTNATANPDSAQAAAPAPEEKTSRGWFGFGRS